MTPTAAACGISECHPDHHQNNREVDVEVRKIWSVILARVQKVFKEPDEARVGQATSATGDSSGLQLHWHSTIYYYYYWCQIQTITPYQIEFNGETCRE